MTNPNPSSANRKPTHFGLPLTHNAESFILLLRRSYQPASAPCLCDYDPFVDWVLRGAADGCWRTL